MTISSHQTRAQVAAQNVVVSPYTFQCCCLSFLDLLRPSCNHIGLLILGETVHFPLCTQLDSFLAPSTSNFRHFSRVILQDCDFAAGRSTSTPTSICVNRAPMEGRFVLDKSSLSQARLCGIVQRTMVQYCRFQLKVVILGGWAAPCCPNCVLCSSTRTAVTWMLCCTAADGLESCWMKAHAGFGNRSSIHQYQNFLQASVFWCI